MDNINYDLEIEKHSPSYIEEFSEEEDIMEDSTDLEDKLGRLNNLTIKEERN